ncbi:hypothetical protein ACFFLM_00170 [Deinococcus oregonensis]|uniref:Fungal lipase-like domain-containing protein n=1 Tax=Deinococcus oregonensis TaxID=1805970 RepID=A0ABV6AW42_9DEIO
MSAPRRQAVRFPAALAHSIRLAPGAERQVPGYAVQLSGQAALERLALLNEVQARQVLSVCAASLSLYPGWERHDWTMPEPQAALRAYGGQFLRLPAVVARLGQVRHVPGRQSYLHAPSGLTFAAYQSPRGNVTLLLGGTNSSHSEYQAPTVPAEVKQVEANLLNLLGRMPQLHRTADLLTLLMRDEVKSGLSIGGHSLGGGLAQYAGLMNGLQVLAFSPTALGRGVLTQLSRLGRLADAPKVLERVQSFSLEGDPIPKIGTRWFHSQVVGLQLQLPLIPGIAPAQHATSHGQIYSHLLAHLRQGWPQLASALQTNEAEQL